MAADHTELGALVRAHRRRLLWTQGHLASCSGVSERTISDVERGVHSTVRLETLRRLADAMSLSAVEAQQLLGLAQAAQRSREPMSAAIGERVAAEVVGSWNLAVEDEARRVEQLSLADTDPAQLCDAMLELGRLATSALRREDARPAYLRAARVAIDLRDVDRCIEAAAGYSFMTKAGDPGVDADDTWRSALHLLDDTDLEARSVVTSARATSNLLARRVEAARDLAGHALSVARRAGTYRCRAIAIAAYCIATRGMPNADERLELAKELEGVGADLGTSTILAGIELAACPHLELGDEAGFRRCADRLAEAGRSDPNPFALAQAEAWYAALALLHGSFDEAEERSARAVSLAGRAPNFTDGYLAQVFSTRRAQGRADELIDELEKLCRRDPLQPAWRAAWAVTCAEADARTAAVDEYLDRAANELWPLPEGWTFPVMASLLAEASFLRRHEHLAALLAAVLRPYAGQLVVPATGTACEGAIDHYLGLALLAAGDPAGTAFLESGRRTHEQLRSSHLVDRSDRALARAGAASDPRS